MRLPGRRVIVCPSFCFRSASTVQWDLLCESSALLCLLCAVEELGNGKILSRVLTNMFMMVLAMSFNLEERCPTGNRLEFAFTSEGTNALLQNQKHFDGLMQYLFNNSAYVGFCTHVCKSTGQAARVAVAHHLFEEALGYILQRGDATVKHFSSLSDLNKAAAELKERAPLDSVDGEYVKVRALPPVSCLSSFYQ